MVILMSILLLLIKGNSLNPNYESVIINLVAAGFSLRRDDRDKCSASYIEPRSASGGLKVAATPFHNLGQNIPLSSVLYWIASEI
jgi:hypothetical protein